MSKLKYVHPLVLRPFYRGFPTGRKIKKFSEKLGKRHKQSRDSQDCFRIKNRFSGRALTNQTSSPGYNVSGGGQKGGRNRPVINLKNLDSIIPYLHFKMEGLHLLKDLLKEKDFMCKIDLKDAYFCVPLHPEHRKYI